MTAVALGTNRRQVRTCAGPRSLCAHAHAQRPAPCSRAAARGTAIAQGALGQAAAAAPPPTHAPADPARACARAPGGNYQLQGAGRYTLRGGAVTRVEGRAACLVSDLDGTMVRRG